MIQKHEAKTCQRCGNNFECKVGNITECQCNAVTFTQEEKDFIKEKAYSDCICVQCMRELKQEYQDFRRQQQMKNIKQR
ncbi:cysteine-rich CWC family protein [Persicobacter psychrovividus]